jgi:Cu/Ag efflux protein CusF
VNVVHSLVLAAAFAGAPLPAHAQNLHPHHGATVVDKPAAALPLTSGVVRKVDAERGTVTIAHDDIKNLDMPKMTMMFRVKDPAWVKKMKEGDKLRFAADYVNGELTVVAWEPAR